MSVQRNDALAIPIWELYDPDLLDLAIVPPLRVGLARAVIQNIITWLDGLGDA